MLSITILTLFPEMFTGPFDQSIIKRAKTQKLLTLQYINIRDFAEGSYKTVDDHPYGGGHGMILRVDVIDRAMKHAKSSQPNAHTILLDPQGAMYTQSHARRLSSYENLIIICAHYEGFDERVRSLVDEEISIGDYVVTGGELPSMILVDSITRLLPGTLKKVEATEDESFTQSLLEYPQYTRPESYNGMGVPSVLLSGNHAEITKWRNNQAIVRTKKKRPDLIKR